MEIQCLGMVASLLIYSQRICLSKLILFPPLLLGKDLPYGDKY